jgi:gamma-glutamyltranspeptidase/glutathione hydrolase
MPPPSSGGVALIEMLNVLQGFDVVGLGHNSSRYVHHLAEVMRRAHLDGARYLADPDQVDVPVQRLTDGLYARDLRVTIDPRRASRSSPTDVVSAGPLRESPETTHFSVVDRDGMAVSVTYTLSESFGVGIAVAGGGFLLNSAMSDFNGRRGLTTSAGMIGSEPNTARPGQRMLSSMSPTILTNGGRLVAVLGSTGGRAIANTILQIILSVVDFSMTPEQAMAAGRIHHQWLPDRIMVEDGGLTPQTVGALQGMGHTVSLQGPQGLAHAIFIDAFTGERVGLPDPRSPGARAVGR